MKQNSFITDCNTLITFLVLVTLEVLSASFFLQDGFSTGGISSNTEGFQAQSKKQIVYRALTAAAEAHQC